MTCFTSQKGRRAWGKRENVREAVRESVILQRRSWAATDCISLVTHFTASWLFNSQTHKHMHNRMHSQRTRAARAFQPNDNRDYHWLKPKWIPWGVSQSFTSALTRWPSQGECRMQCKRMKVFSISRHLSDTHRGWAQRKWRPTRRLWRSESGIGKPASENWTREYSKTKMMFLRCWESPGWSCNSHLVRRGWRFSGAHFKFG